MKRAILASALLACGTSADPRPDAMLTGWWDAGPPIDGGPDSEVTCPEVAAECDGDRTTTCETFLWDDELACGDCNIECTSGELCVAGACMEPEILALSAGEGFTCARLVDRHVVCWGANERGELGDGFALANGNGPRSAPSAVLGLDGAGFLTSATHTTCVTRDDLATVACWGDNDAEIFGEPGADHVQPLPSRARGNGEIILGLSVMSAQLCVMMGSGVSCVGHNDDGAIGQLDADTDLTLLTPVPGLPRALTTSVACGGASGYGHTCVANFDGDVYCFGANADAQCGRASPASVFGAQIVKGLPGIFELVAGRQSTCARTLAGEVFCWGDNANGQLGRGATSGADPVPQQVLGIPLMRSIHLRAVTVLAVSQTGDEVWGWGDGMQGQLGNDIRAIQPAPVRVMASPGADYIAAVGVDHACIYDRTTHDLWCAGSNVFGQLGEDGPDRATFERVPW